MDILKDLFYQHYIQGKEYQKSVAMSEVREADRNVTAYINKFNRKDFLELEDLIADLGSACEMQGFICGFRYAMQLAAACGIKAGAVQ